MLSIESYLWPWFRDLLQILVLNALSLGLEKYFRRFWCILLKLHPYVITLRTSIHDYAHKLLHVIIQTSENNKYNNNNNLHFTD